MISLDGEKYEKHVSFNFCIQLKLKTKILFLIYLIKLCNKYDEDSVHTVMIKKITAIISCMGLEIAKVI